MKTTALAFLALALVINGTLAMGHGKGHGRGGHGKGGHGDIMQLMKAAKEAMGDGEWDQGDACSTKPPPLFMKIFGLMCDVENCAENTPKCMDAMMPHENICEHMEECRPDGEDTSSRPNGHGRRRKPLAMKKMAECIMKSMMESMGLEYVPGDNKANTLAVMEVTLGSSSDLTDATKDNMLSAITDHVCVTPTDQYNKMAKMKFVMCLMRTCLESMAEQ